MTSRKRASDTTVIGSESNAHTIPTGKHSLITANNNSKTGSNYNARPKLKVRIKRWHGVTHWTWNCGEEEDVCGICQSAYEGVAPGGKFPGDECPVVWGNCGHSFHLQCITTWLATRSTCPMCRSEWEFAAEKTVEEGDI